RQNLWKDGLKTKLRDTTFAKLAERVIEISEGGLERRGVKNANGKDERVHLARLKKLVGEGKSPADKLLEELNAAPDPKRLLVERPLERSPGAAQRSADLRVDQNVIARKLIGERDVVSIRDSQRLVCVRKKRRERLGRFVAVELQAPELRVVAERTHRRDVQ